MTTKPLVSVTICTYNRAGHIRKAIASVLAQTYENLEIIVVDDASTDNTREIVLSIASPRIPIRYHLNAKNLNIAGTRNKTVKFSDGKYIAILDSDDYWIDVDKIKKQVEFLESHPECALIGSGAMVIDENDKNVGDMQFETDSQKIKEDMLLANQFAHSSVLYRKDSILANGGFNKNNSPFEDYDLLLKIGRKKGMANLTEQTVAYRKHTGNASARLSIGKKILFLTILLRNFPYYPKRIRSIIRRLKL